MKNVLETFLKRAARFDNFQTMLSQRTAPTALLRTSPVNERLVERAEALWADVLSEGLRRGFHGVVSVELIIQDGTIQLVRRKAERVEK